MTKASGAFEVLTAAEDPIDELGGGIKRTHASGTQAFSGDIEGDGSIHWLMLYRGDTTAHLVGLQRITGSVGGRRGSFVIAAVGDHDGAASQFAWTVVRGSGTGDLAGIAGTGRMVAPGGRTGSYELEYQIEG
jgi:hypothetical protein